jgi:transcriptional regulator GlxA family with amidase domain
LWFARFFQLIRPCLPGQAMFIDPRIQNVCAFIRNNLARTMRISDLARHVFTSESHLRMLFRKTLGISPMDYLQQERMRRTKELLLNTEFSIKEISEKTGFANQNMFSRAFVNFEGIGPRGHRKRLREHGHR